MSKRNFILLIITLVLVVFAVYGFLYFRTDPNTPVTDLPGINFLSQFNPFASKPTTPDTGTPTGDLNGDGTISEEEMLTIKLKKVSSMPIAGFTVFNKERLKETLVVAPPTTPEALPTDETPAPTPVPKKIVNTKPIPPATEFVPAVRYVARADGNIYQTYADKIEERKFSTTVIPKVYDAYFGNKGQSVTMRNLRNERVIQTFVGNLPKEKLGEDVASNELKGVFLNEGIKDISVSPDTSKIFYLSNVKNSSTGTILNLIDNKKAVIFNSAFTEWNSFWGSNKTISLTTKPSSTVPGHMYIINTDNNNLTRVLGDITGLTTLMSPNGKLVLVGNNALSLYIYHTDTKLYDSVGLKSLPEKCVWENTSNFIYCAVPVTISPALYPDDWYRGEISFSDQIWKIDVQTGSTTLLVDPVLTQNGEDIDGTKLALDENENYLFFVNKKDSFLWELGLK